MEGMMETRNKMMMMDQESNNNSNERKRKSRFDIAPPSSSLISSWTNIDVSANTANLSVPNFSIEGPQSIPLSLSVSVVDVAFRERLDRAMEKNLAYIERKDSLATSLAIPSSSNGILHGASSNLLQSKAFSHYSSRAAIKDRPAVTVMARDKLGVVEAQPQGTTTGCTAVYVTNLPLDITDEEIGILFGPVGKVKKIKIYEDSEGRKKGDALVTFVKSEAAAMACLKLNRLDIGDGFVISVAMANFSAKSSSVSPEGDVKVDDWGTDDLIRQSLVDEDEVLRSSPLLLLLHPDFDKAVHSDSNQLADIEADLLLECCVYGNVKAFAWITLWNQHNCAAVVFETLQATQDSALAMQSKTFRGKELKAKLFQPSQTGENNSKVANNDPFNLCSTAHLEENRSSLGHGNDDGISPAVGANHQVSEENASAVDLEERIAAELAGVDDFLNSLL